MPTTETILPPVNQQGLDIRSTRREEMNLYPLDTFPYEFVGREIRINFEMPEFTAICPFSDFPDFANIRLAYVPDNVAFYPWMTVRGTLDYLAPERIRETRPDYVLILPWNLKDEIIEQLAYTREWGARFVVPIPEVTVYGQDLARQGGPR